jgi:elongation factor Ts
MEINASQVKQLREQTGAGMMDCKAALTEARGDVEQAVTILRKKGLAAAAKKAGRTTAEGLIASYIHAGGKIGVLLEVNCETDFVAKNAEFQGLVRDIAMHVAASNPRYVRREDVPAAELEAEKQIYRDQAKASGKPEAVIDKIATGKLDRYFSEFCLLEQPFVKDPDRTVQDLIHDAVSRMGENIQVRRFIRFALGEAAEDSGGMPAPGSGSAPGAN